MTPGAPASPVTAVKGTFDTFAEVMDAAAVQLTDNEAYVEVDTGRRLNFGEWRHAADAAAARMAARGVRPGDVVAIALPPSIDYAIACAGALRLGAVASGINTRLGPRETAGIMAGCEPRLVVDNAFELRRSRGSPTHAGRSCAR